MLDIDVRKRKKMNCDQISNQAATAADDSDRIRKVFESKAQAVMINSLMCFYRIYFLKDEERMAKLEEDLKQVRNKAEESDKQYDEVSKKLQITEGELEKAEERGENGEMKIMELEEELKVVATDLKSLEVSEEKANQREIANKEQVKNLTAKLKQAEARAEFAERSVQKLNQEVIITYLFLPSINYILNSLFVEEHSEFHGCFESR